MGNMRKWVLGGLAILAITGDLGCDSNMFSSEEKKSSREKKNLTRWHEMEFVGEDKRDKRKDYVENFAGLDMKMIWIPGGEVEYEVRPKPYYRKNEPFPIFREEVEGFWIGETEVSIDQWLKFLEVSNYTPSKDTHRNAGGMPIDIRNPDLPVKYVSFLNATFFTDYLSSRTRKNYGLPTLSEWIYACRGSKIPPEGPFGKLSKKNANIDWEEEVGNRLMPVKSLEPNEFGLYHLVGNNQEYVTCPNNLKYSLFSKNELTDKEEGIILTSSRADNPDCFQRNHINREPIGDLLKTYPIKPEYIYGQDFCYGFRVVRRPSDND
jgi:formylglycine-generating enzyme required for sulfatase activity